MSFLEFTRFRVCPLCGDEDMVEIAHNAIKCKECGYVYFHNCAAAAGAIVEMPGGVLLLRRSKDPGAGKLGLPGGFVDYNESFEEAVIREVREETGIKVENLRYLCTFPNTYVYKKVTYFTTDAFFVAQAAEGAVPKADHETDEVLVIPAASIDPAELAFDSARSAILKYLA